MTTSQDPDSAPRCFACKGPYHPATGHVFGLPYVGPVQDTIRAIPRAWFGLIAYCGACYRHFADFMKRHTRAQYRRGAVWDFYAAANTSIRPGIWPPASYEGGEPDFLGSLI